MTSQQTGGLKPTRRTLVKGAAWSVPVVAVGSSAPAFAASPPPDECLDIAPGGEACKDPGAQAPAFAYNLQYCFTNTCETGTIIVNVTRLRAANNNSYDITINEVLTIPAGEYRCTNVYSVNGSNSSNFQAVHYVVGGVEYIDDRVAAPPTECLTEDAGEASVPAEEDALAEQASTEKPAAPSEEVAPPADTTATDGAEKNEPFDPAATSETVAPPTDTMSGEDATTIEGAANTEPLDPAVTTAEPQNG